MDSDFSFTIFEFIYYLFYLDQVGSDGNCSTEQLYVLSLLAPTQEDGFLEPHLKGILLD